MMLASLKNDSLQQEQLIDFGYYFHLIKKRWGSISLFTLLCTAIAVLIALSITPMYRATATLLIESSQQRAISIEEVVGIDTSAKEYYLTQFEILKSNQVAQRVIEKLKLNQVEEFNPSLAVTQPGFIDNIKNELLSHPLIEAHFAKDTSGELDFLDKQEAINRVVLKTFKSRLTISPIRKTQLVNISFESQDPKLAAKIANAVGLAFIENNLESKLIATEQATGWINQRLSELKQNLNDSEQALLQFLQQQKLIDNSGIEALTSSELSSLTTRIAEATDKRIEAQALYNALNNNKGSSSPGANSLISNHPQIRDIRLAESNAEKEVSELSKRYGPKHDKMIQANAQLQSIQSRIEVLTAKLVSGIKKELASAKEQERALKNELLSKKSEFQALSVVKSEYDALKREVNSNAKLYDLFLIRQKETSATSDFSAANARFSDYALIPEFPSKPNRKLIVILAFIASASFAVVLVICLDAFNNTITSARDFENKLGLLPTGTIPVIKDKRYKKSPIDANVFNNNKFTLFQESIDSIRTSLYLILPKSERKLLAISSSVPGEGKTTTAISLAHSFSQLEKVLIIDCDLRKPSVGERFGLPHSHPGLSNILLMNTPLEECITSIKNSNLDVLSAGMFTPNPQELLSSAAFEQLIADLTNKYDRIILDTPPILPVKDAFIVGKLTQGILLVVKVNSTSKSVYKHTMTLFTKHQITIDGVVLNRVLPPKKGTHTYSEYSQYTDANKG
ncbi:polysaccharide biosynthesis tyrosine autokinase [Aliivibrio sp. S4TY2]|uniref:GumC family protein n=1 Tax=unclassified Aliivibrio TaxID=2645654 RepID=UPI0023793B46|nr:MULTISPECIES: polysaccharide biosynthesis tyrosine autokinase [unclassified Aliivibrio]MDD9156046.1 polysaccharide biosynthesis tyrosine autokinase [Aliivibrio sp. S4TY2]MDD9159755.1 polysaccharide biosynthesis tyrosine autokinase [Aliivibrio sp. S4TY1]MDD9163754.1 polysaccharide biosynthesis tyrosine autokinase [Aliivibrio sp. S4MY2]MDD9167755.1 polysaccharide biosynthesis tyrosine autokinase [Aliivibrio sp. S4MY4]MDD9185581.1 polysaccharide biosynthesis tyrosine autokinase [Aliivibrio sp.